MSKYRMCWDGEVWILQKKKLFFFWEDVIKKVETIDGIDFVEPFHADEELSESEALRYFKLMNFDPDAKEPEYTDIMDVVGLEFESIMDDETFEKEIDDEIWVSGDRVVKDTP